MHRLLALASLLGVLACASLAFAAPDGGPPSFATPSAMPTVTAPPAAMGPQLTEGQTMVLMLAPLLAAAAAFARRFTPAAHWAHEAWFPALSGVVSAALSALADLARAGSLSKFTALAAVIGAFTAALASYKPTATEAAGAK